MVYYEITKFGKNPASEILEEMLACLQVPYDTYVKNILVQNVGESCKTLAFLGFFAPNSYKFGQI